MTALHGDVRVRSLAIADIKTQAIAGQAKESALKNVSERIDPGALVVTFLTQILPYIIFPPVSVPATIAVKKWYNAPARALKRLEKLRKKLSVGDYEVKIADLNDENAKMGSATVAVKLRSLNGDVVNNENQANTNYKEQEGYLVGVVTPAPKAGYMVDKVMYRYLVPGEETYQYAEATRDENAGVWWFALPEEDTTIAKKSFETFVIFKADPNAQQQAQQQEQQQEQPAQEEDHEMDYLYEDGFNINNMILDGEEAAEGNADEEPQGAIEPQAPEAPQQGEEQQEEDPREYTLSIVQYTVQGDDHDDPDQNSKLLTWQAVAVQENGKTVYKNLSTIHGGQQIRFIGNTKADRQLDLVTVFYWEDEELHNKREIRIARNSLGHFVFTVPNDVREGAIFYAEPTFGPAVDNRAEKADQFTGAFAAGIVLNKSTAAIQPGDAGNTASSTQPDVTKVTAGGSVDLISLQKTDSDTLADGSAITEKLLNLGEDKDRVIDYTLSKWTVTGAQNVVKADSSVAGTITTTMENDEHASPTHPIITFTPAGTPDYDTIKIRIAYYTKMNINPFGTTMVVRDCEVTAAELENATGTLTKYLSTASC